MSSGNQELDQQFDDDMMLQLALQMSLQPQTHQGNASESSSSAEIAPAEPSVVAAELTDVAAKEQPDETSTPNDPAVATEQPKPAETPKKKKKAKKNRYKDIIASRMASSRTEEEAQQEHREMLKATMGGGQFSKVEKI